jgi:phosphatidyl-myo-inositol dimannoside synthase
MTLSIEVESNCDNIRSALDPPHIRGAQGRKGMNCEHGKRVQALLLSPSRGLGGGIERYVHTVEYALAAEGIGCQRLDLGRSGFRAHARLLAEGRAVLRAAPEPTRLIVAHRALLPVAALLARNPTVCGTSVLCHGSDVWGSRWRPRRSLERRLMQRHGVRMIAISAFTAGVLMRDCAATVLPPGLSREWFDSLAAAAADKRDHSPGIRLATAFRLADWRGKGLPQLLVAVTALGRPDVSLTICGSGDPPADLVRLASGSPWCTIRPGLSDRDLARELAAADLFILATQTMSGRRAFGEGFGLVLLEAQIAGTPVVAPAFGGSREAYVDGVTGTAPADESPEALARTLHDMLKDPVRLALMGRHAAQWAQQAFAPEHYAQLAAGRLL